MILSADIGGTKTALGLSLEEEPIKYVRSDTYLNSEFDSLPQILDHFLQSDLVSIMVLGIAGPVTSRKVDLTNIDWIIDADALEDRYNCQVHLLNDLAAAAHAIPYLMDSDIVDIYEANHESNMEVVVAVGTGLGKASIYKGAKRVIFSSEGGHIGFSPKTDFQRNLFDYLQDRAPHVSYEMVCSTVGFNNLRAYILDHNPLNFSKPFLDSIDQTNNFSRLIFETASSNHPESEVCRKVIKEFSMMIGSFLGDMVLLHLPTKIYLTGGIGRNILDPSSIVKGYLMKANMTEVVQSVPISIIKDPNCGLHGTSWYAKEILSSQ